MPHPRVTGNTRPELKGLKESPPNAKFSMAKGRSTKERDYSFLSVNTGFSDKNSTYNGNSIRNKKENSRKSTFQHYSSVLQFSTKFHYYRSVLNSNTTVQYYYSSLQFIQRV